MIADSIPQTPCRVRRSIFGMDVSVIGMGVISRDDHEVERIWRLGPNQLFMSAVDYGFGNSLIGFKYTK